MIRFIMLFLCPVSLVIANFEQDLDLFLKDPNSQDLGRIEQGVLDGACIPYEFTAKRELYEKICFARVWIPIKKGQWLDAYRILLDVKSDFSKEKLTQDWSGLEKIIKEKLTQEQIGKAEREFNYFMEHGEYPDSDANLSIPDSPEIPASASISGSDEGSVHSDIMSSVSDGSARSDSTGMSDSDGEVSLKGQ